MTKILPFKAVRPAREFAGLVASRSYEDYNEEELKAQLEFNPYSFLHIINPGYKFQHEIGGEKRFGMVKNRYLEFREDCTFIQDELPSYYIYKIHTRDGDCCGIIAAASVEDYENNIIKRHEDTIAHREELFKEYLKVVGFNTEPVLLTYPDDPVINDLLKERMKSRPEYEFATANKEIHSLWLIDEPENIEKIRQQFAAIQQLYIADGHHRTASSFRLSKEKGPKFFMSFLINEDYIKIYSFNRILMKLKDLNKENLILELSKKFVIKEIKKLDFQSKKENEILLYLKNNSYSLIPKKESYNGDILSRLSYSILSNNIINPLFNLDDNSEKIKYYNGKKNIEEITKIIDKNKNSLAFFLKPIKMKNIRKIADQNLVLPPKSTYIEPKLRSGITILDLK